MRTSRSIATTLLLAGIALASATGPAQADSAEPMSERFAAEHAGDKPVSTKTIH